MNFLQRCPVTSLEPEVMADRNRKGLRNVAGKYYVDDTCIDCDLCREIAPQTFRRDEETGNSYVHRQPGSGEEIALAEEAARSCPTETIGKDGEGWCRRLVSCS